MMSAAVNPFAETVGRKIPVFAAGGVFTGKDIGELMACGADGVQMATRFIATEECDADDGFKQAIIDSREEDIGIVVSPVGMPARAIQSPFDATISLLRTGPRGSASPGTSGRGADQVRPRSCDTDHRVVQVWTVGPTL